MKNFAEFAIIGNVGSVKTLKNATRFFIASNYRRRAEDGAWTDDTHWNHVVVFSEATRKVIDEQVAKGSLIVAGAGCASLPTRRTARGATAST